MKKQCFIFTRFNVGVYSQQGPSLWGKDRPTTFDKELWMQHRFDLLQTICLPSVKLQVGLKAWIIIIDADTPDTWKDMLRQLTKSVTNTDVILVETNKHYCDEGAASLYALNTLTYNLADTDSLVATCNLDSDCAMHPNYIATIQDLECTEFPVVVDTLLVLGLNIDVDNKVIDMGCSSPKHTTSSQCLIENHNFMLKTVLEFGHMKLYTKYTVIYLPDITPVITHHSNNVVCRNRTIERVSPTAILTAKMVSINKRYNLKLELS
jgi:hypothetical protein